MPYILAHRGFHLNHPENTLSAFEAAANAGADGIELDLHVSGDGHLPVFHDQSFIPAHRKRPIKLKEHSFRELATLSEQTYGEAMPELKRVLDRFLDAFAWINIELKGQGLKHYNMQLVKKTLTLLKHYPTHKIVISSFHPLLLRYVKDHNPAIATGFLMQPRTITAHTWEFWLSYTRADFFHPRYDWYFRRAHAYRRRTRLALWTLDNHGKYHAKVAGDRHIEFIVTNRPDLWNGKK